RGVRQCRVDLSELFTQGKEILHGQRLCRVLDRLDEGKRGETSLIHLGEIDGGGGSPEIGDSSREGPDQRVMAFWRRPLLQFVQRHMNVLQPFVVLLDKEIDELFLKFI